MDIDEVKRYFYSETKDFEISEIILADTKYSYFDSVECFKISTKQEIDFYVFSGDVTLTNVYPARKGESLDECYYKHVGFMAEYSSNALNSNYVLKFIKDTSVFPILDRRMSEICEDITLDKNANQLNGLANQIRDCYIVLSDYLMNKARSNNPAFKQANFTGNLEEFLKIIIPGTQSESRRNVINCIAKKGWAFNSELVHKKSITIFDVLMSFNTLQLVVSSASNIVAGNGMPFNKIKCPHCMSEKHTMKYDIESKNYTYVCEDCHFVFEVPLDDIIKAI